MISTHQTTVTKDSSGKKLLVTRDFSAPLEKVWRAWTESELLDQWWAPRPYTANTKEMNFSDGGRWLYFMAGPEGDKHWCKVDFEKIVPQKSFSASDGFCDEDGNTVNVGPIMHWFVQFASQGEGTRVTVDITFDSEQDLEQIVAMGFKEGFTMAHGNLDELLEQA